MTKLNTNLIKAILKTDFLFLENSKQKNRKIINLASNKNLIVLDVVELNSRLKQFIRILQFIKKRQSFVNILIDNKQYLKILNYCFSKNKNEFSNIVNINDNQVKNLQKMDYLNLYLFLNKTNNFKDAFFIQEINSDLKKNNLGNYKILNSLNSFKKIIFLLSLFQSILKDTNKIKFNN